MFSVSSRHWLGVWAGLEINLIGFLPILIYQKRILERESAVKYFIIQALGSSLLIFGRLFRFDIRLSWEALGRSYFPHSRGVALLGTGLLIKIGVFPFHLWLPRVIAGLSWLACLILATWQKLAPILLVLSLSINSSSIFLIFLLSALGAGSGVIGGLGGLNQTQIRALLAYSSIGHIGWMLLGIALRERAVKAYFVIYILISVCIFVRLWSLDINNIKGLGSLIAGRHLGGLSFLVILLSLGGLPPLLGFISKWIVISAAATSPLWSFIILLILGSLISLFYYLRLFFSEVLAVNSERTKLEKFLKLKGHLLINIILLLNCLGGGALLLIFPYIFA